MNIFDCIDPKTRKADFTKIKKHPRLLFTREKIKQSKENIEKYDLYKRFYNETADYADKAIRGVVPRQTDEHLGFAWRFCAYLPMLGSAYLLSGEKKYFDKATEWLGEFKNYKFSYEHPDLDTSLTSIAAALIYDWFYDELPAGLKEEVREKLLYYAKNLYRFANLKEDYAWSKMVMQNHNHLAIAALGTIALSIYDEYPDLCREYIDTAVSRFSATFEITGEDGCFHEGFGYWYYGFLTPFMMFTMLKDNVDVDFFNEKWFERVPDYILFNYYGENSFTPNYEYFPFADDVGRRRTKECMLRLVANVTKHKELQYFAQVAYDKKLTTYHGAFLNFIWNDPELEGVAPAETDYPLSCHFENYDYAFARESWRGDEACFGVHCGTPLGKKWKEIIKNVPFYELGAAHVHPDAGHFILFGKGQPLFYDDEYSYYKETANHNTLLINKKGQKGEKIDWFNVSRQYLDSNQTIEHFYDNGDYVVIACDMKDAYDGESLITELKRYFIYLRYDDCLLIFDKVRADKENEISALFWPWDENITGYGRNRFLITGEKANVKLFASENLKGSYYKKENHTRYYREKRQGISFDARVKDAEFMYAISFCDACCEPCEIKLSKEEGGFSAVFKNKKVTFDLSRLTVDIEAVAEEKNIKEPVKLFSNGREIKEFTPSRKEYRIEKLPWQKENYFFFTGEGYAPSGYKAELYNVYPVGLGNTGIKNLYASSYYYRGDYMNALSDNPEEMWICDMLDDYMIIELEKVCKIESVILSFGNFERFRTKVCVLYSEDGEGFKSLYEGISDEEVLKIKLKEAVNAGFIKIVNLGNSYNSFLNINKIGIEKAEF